MAQHLEADEAPGSRTLKRRALAAWLACAALPVRPQGARSGSELQRIAWVSGSRADARSPFLAALRQGLGEAGRVEGRDFGLDAWWGDDSMERFDTFVAEELRSRPDLHRNANRPPRECRMFLKELVKVTDRALYG